MAIRVANIASHWSALEQAISFPYTYLLAGREESAFEAYHELFEINLRQKMFIAVAKRKKMPRELLDEAHSLHAKVRKSASQRNSIVHGLWAYADDLPNSILLCEPSAQSRKMDQFFGELHEKWEDFYRPDASWSFDMNIDEYQEYRENDFEEFTKRIIELITMSNEYSGKVLRFSLAVEQERRERRKKP